MASTVATVATGCLPRSVSAPSRIASTPSRTAFATSVASARVGRGAVTMVSTTRVMRMGLPARLAAAAAAFWMSAIFSGGASSPRLPRDRMTPSAASRMASNSSRDWRVSSLARMRVAVPPPSGRPSKKSRHSATSATDRVNESDTKSTSYSATRAAMASLSSLQSAGRSFCALASPAAARSQWKTVSSPPSDAALAAVAVMVSPSTAVAVR